jgi:hypothetical protein
MLRHNGSRSENSQHFTSDFHFNIKFCLWFRRASKVAGIVNMLGISIPSSSAVGFDGSRKARYLWLLNLSANEMGEIAPAKQAGLSGPLR